MPRGEITEIGKYRIVGQIGEGAMGIVYRALDPILNRPVAIKVMSDALARDNDLRSRFLREAQSAGSLQHPNVITIYDFGEVDGHPYIAMEFVEGADLNEILEKHSPLSLVEKIDILIDVLNGLAYAHKRGIVHRDIKPANIRIDEDGRARIMDFGIAHVNSSSMTRTGTMVGTPAYMSPEQITGGEIAAASDIFALGAVMYELLTGVQAFRGESLQAVMYKIVSAPAPELGMVADTLSPERGASVSNALAGIVSRALAKDPSRRFENALQMAGALSEVRARLQEQNETTRRPSLRATVAKVMAEAPEAMDRRVRRRQAIAAAVGAGVVLVVAVIALALSGGGRRAPEPSTAAASVAPPVAANAPAVQPPAAIASPSSVRQDPPRSTAPATAPSSAARDAPSPSTTTPSADERSLFRALQSTALESRRRAADAGVSAVQLSAGDGHNKMASALALKGRISEAADHLNQAAASWSGAERTGRAASAAAATAMRTSAAEPAKPQAPPTVATVTPVTPVTQPQTQQAPPPPAANVATDIAAAVGAYARALESRDLGTVRRAYPGITPAQAQGWEQFFSTLRSLRVNLSVNGLEVTGSTAEARLVGAYDYVTEAGKAAQQPVSFQATFRREGSAWQLMSVH